MRKPLEGLFVVEMTSYWSATTTARFLRDMGARVVRVETPPIGDFCRYYGRSMGMPITAEENPIHDIFNGGKECVALDLKDPKNLKLMQNMLAKADVFITSTRTAGLKKLGLDWETLHAKYPKLVMGQVTGYGINGPLVNRPGIDAIAYFGANGVILDTRTDPDSPPIYPPAGMGDTTTGITLLSGVLAALLAARETGVGDYVMTSLYGTGNFVTAGFATNCNYGYEWPREAHTMSPLGQGYKCRDGRYIYVFVNDYTSVWPKFAKALRLPEEVVTDPRFTTKESTTIIANRSALVDIIREYALQRDAQDILDELVAYWAHPPMYFDKGVYLPFAEQVKQVVDVPVLAAGRMDDPDLAAQALRDGRCDMIGLARPLLAEPDYVRKVRNDELALIRPCLCCHEGCFGRAFDGAVGSCAVNPECARERLVGITPVAEKKRVVVVGGGPAGLEAARVSALRGHDVTLLEASDALGGALKSAGVPHFKQADRDLVAWYAATLAHLGVDVRLNTRADKALLDSLKPQTVFVAEGSTPRTLALPGADGDNVVSALDVLEGKAKAGKSVVIIGAGLVACELALHLVQNGHTVTLLARRKLLRSAKLPAMNELMLRDLLVFHGVHIVEGAALESVDAKGVYYEVEGVPALAEGDTVITAVGMEANHALFDAIRDDYETVLALGDGRRVRNIFGAIWDGYEAARSL